MRAFIFHLGCDPSPIVRRTIIKCIGATRLTLPHVVRRTLDVDERVRRLAYKFIADKIHIKSLTIAQREEIVKRGLTDRNENVRKMVSKELVPSWLRLCNDNIVELLYALDVGNSDGETAKEVLNVIFQDVPHKELVENFCYIDPATKLVPATKLTPETAVYWRNLTRFLYDEIETRGVMDATPYLEALLPELSQFCQYIRQFILEHSLTKNTNENLDSADDGEDEEAKEVAWFFVAKQLIEMTSVFDLSDEMGRNNLAKLCREIMLSRKVTPDFVDPVMRIFSVVQNSPSSRIQEIAEIIAELRDPLLLRDNAERKADDQGDEGFGDGDDDVKAVDETLQSEFDAMENANKVLSKAEQARKEDEHRKKQVAIAKVRVQMNILKDDLEEAIQNQDFMRAQQMKVDMDKLHTEQIRLQDELTEAAAMAPVPSSDAKKNKRADGPESSVKSGATKETSGMEIDGQEIDASVVKSDDPLMIHKCLKMLGVMLEWNDIKSTNATLQTLLDEFVVPSVQNVDCHIRNSAVKAMGGCCLRSLDASKRHLLLILQIAHLDTPEVRITALNVIYDLLMWHGLPAFITNNVSDNQSKDESDLSKLVQDDELSNLESALDSEQGCSMPTQKQFETHGGNSVVAILSQLLDDPDIEIRTRVAEGLCKLMMCGSISSPKLFTRLILIWYNPITEADGKLRHILGTFFPLYSSFSRTNQDSVEESFMPTLKTLFDAPPTSPLTDVDIEDVGAFFIQLTRADILQQTYKKGSGSSREDNENGDIASDIGAAVHDAMAYTLCNQILASPDSFQVKTLIRLLLNLQITSDNFVKLKELKLFHTQMTTAVRDKLCLKSLERFGTRLDEWLRKDPELEKEKIEEIIAIEPNPEQEQDKTSDSQSEEELNINATTIKKKRTLFTHNATTMLDLTRAVGNDSGADSNNSNVSASKSSSQAEKNSETNISIENEEIGNTCTDIEDKTSSDSGQPPKKLIKIIPASSEESEEEEVVSGNIFRNNAKSSSTKNKYKKAESSTKKNDMMDVLTSTQSTTILTQAFADSDASLARHKGKKPSSRSELEEVLSPVKRRSSSRKKNVVEHEKSPEPFKVAKKSISSSSAAATSPPSSLFPSSSEDTEEEEKDMPDQNTKQKRALLGKRLAECVVNITPNSRVTKVDLKTTYTPKALSNKVASQTREKKNLVSESNDSGEADEDSEREVPIRETKTRGRKGRSKSNTREDKTIVDETESEEDEAEPPKAQRGRGLRTTQSTNSIHTKISSSRTRTSSRSGQSTSGANSSMDSDTFLSPSIPGKAFVEPQGTKWYRNRIRYKAMSNAVTKKFNLIILPFQILKA